MRRLILAALLLALPVTAMAQNPLGRLTGVVRDASDAVLPGATVTVYNDAQGSSRTEITSEIGAFTFTQLPIGTYRVVIELAGFKTQTYTQVVINVGQEYSLSAKLAIGELSETVQVTAGELLIKTTTPEVSATVQQKQVLDIPLANRDVTNLIKLQMGVVGIINRTNTTINGGRPTWTQVTLDGINIQDNFIRTNSLDFLPNRPNSDNVAEFSITTSVSGADSAGGATSVRMVTPSGTNTFRGSIFEFNRDSKFAANSFFNNAAGVPIPELKRNQYGGRIGGPILRNKLFFFANYEGFRQETQTSQNLTIPANTDFTSGVYRYVGLDGAVRSVNVMALSGLRIDPKLQADFLSKIPAPSNVNNYNVGNSTAARLLNTAGYRFNQTDLNNRDQFTFRLDYDATLNHKFEGVFSYFKETDDRTDLDFISSRPLVYTSSDPKRFALAWRWMASSRLQNELRVGANLAPVQFASDWDYEAIGGVLYNTALGIVNPVGGWGSGTGFLPQGRYTDTYQVNDSLTFVMGNHQIQAGGSWQRNRVNPYNYAGSYPTVNFGFSAAAPANVQLNSAMFPGGISATDLANANAMAAWLGGIVSSTSRTFQVKDATSGYVPGIPANEFYTLDNIAAYVQDNWRWRPNFTVRAGLKWEYYSPLREDNNLGFLPVINGRSISDVMLDPNAQITFADGDFWKKDLNNFGPTVGFAWDLTSDGKTAVRGGYSLAFVNEESVTAGRSAARGNSGLTSTVALTSQYATVSGGVPLPATPAFLSTRTLADQRALSATAILWGIDPEIQAPHVHQVSLGIQRELPWSTAAEARYVGTFGRNIWRGTDYNQIKISPEFLADFKAARNNGYLAQAAGLAFSPLYNPNVPGSVPLAVLPSFGLLTNATALNHIQTNSVGALADFYITSRVAGAINTFMQNPGIYAAQGLSNGGFSDYHGLQFELRRQFRNGFFAQANYSFSHSNTNSAGTAQNRFEAFMDNYRPELNT
ncbi:MAG: TonB-dependent receptor, partial [Vicinamibacterales bacterium]|nr:TonB-dependent receptor [Vicinamibacterales bacterium]